MSAKARTIGPNLFLLYAIAAIAPLPNAFGDSGRIEKALRKFEKKQTALDKSALARLDRAAAAAKRKGEGAKWEHILEEKSAFAESRKLPKLVKLTNYESSVRKLAWPTILEFRKSINRALSKGDRTEAKELRKRLARYLNSLSAQNPGVAFRRTSWVHPIGKFQLEGETWIERINHTSHSFEKIAESPDRIVLYDRARKIGVALYDDRCVVKSGRKKSRVVYKGKWVLNSVRSSH